MELLLAILFSLFFVGFATVVAPDADDTNNNDNNNNNNNNDNDTDKNKGFFIDPLVLERYEDMGVNTYVKNLSEAKIVVFDYWTDRYEPSYYWVITTQKAQFFESWVEDYQYKNELIRELSLDELTNKGIKRIIVNHDDGPSWFTIDLVSKEVRPYLFGDYEEGEQLKYIL